MKREKIETSKAPAAIGPYSQAIKTTLADGVTTLYASGQIAIEPSTGKLVEGGIESQTHRVMQNIGAILEKAGMGYSDVVKTTCLLADINDFGIFNDVYSTYFKEDPSPARSTFAVAALPKSALVEVEVVAIKRQ
ncbi:MAG: RidA family protein [Marinilabiliaceae bacterium]|nr:RidA family protein [Marinilabiliaceae bacterium]